MKSFDYLAEISKKSLHEHDWLMDQLQQESNFKPSEFYLSFNLVHRKIPEYSIAYSDQAIQEWANNFSGIDITKWNSRSVARALMVLSVPTNHMQKVLDDLFSTGDIGEQELLYQILISLPEPALYVSRASEGIRTNMTRVFDAIALNNPYPAEYFSQEAWNQMVLKAIFMNRPLYQIVGLDARRNEDLSRIARDFAHERWAAGRDVTPELWRLAVPFLNDEALSDIAKALKSENEHERLGAALALKDSNSPKATNILNENNMEIPDLTWDELGRLNQEEI